ncbi:MAG: trigger factor [Bacteroidales bacterium]
MDINRENKDEQNAVLKVQVKQEDYQENVDAVIKDYKKKAKMDGFRPGKVPEGLIRKMYGKAIKIDEINKIVSQKLNEYIQSEKLKVLGEPLPSKEEQDKTINWDQDKEFEFAFDIGLAPEIEVKISKHDKVPYYKIKITDDLIDKQKEEYLNRMGEFKNVDEISNNDELLKADLTEMDEEGNVKDEGIFKENISLSLSVIKDEEIKKQFEKAKPEDEIVIDLKKAYPNDTELASLLEVQKEELENISNYFRVFINEIKKFEKAEINQEFYDKLYGEGEVTSEEEFNEKIKADLEQQFKPESERKVHIDIKDHFVRKINPKLPSEFLKRWIKATQQNENLTEEQIDNEFPHFEHDVKWDLIKNKIIEDNEIKVEEDEVLELAKRLTQQQFQQYGMMNFPEEQLEQYAKQLLSNEEQRKKIHDQKLEEKVIEHIKENIKLNEKEVTLEEFKKQVEEDQNKQSS